jgi:hypothetical protein
MNRNQKHSMFAGQPFINGKNYTQNS